VPTQFLSERAVEAHIGAAQQHPQADRGHRGIVGGELNAWVLVTSGELARTVQHSSGPYAD
jgi:hypothetical protein